MRLPARGAAAAAHRGLEALRHAGAHAPPARPHAARPHAARRHAATPHVARRPALTPRPGDTGAEVAMPLPLL
eukprot:scaffold108614_cov42-Phaeocystis_antarctica.AAC.2